MANEEFNKMLDDYMGGIRRKSSIHFSEKFKKFFRSKPKKKIQIDRDTTEEYIDVRKDRLENAVIEEKNGFFAKLFKLFSAKPKPEMPEENSEIVSEKSIEEFKEPEIEYEEPVVKEMKENFIIRLFKKIFHHKKKDIEEPEEEPEIKTYNSEMDEDVVKVLNIINSLFKKLPQNVKYQFRNSEDFEIYSKVLNKYHIMKKE